MDQNIEVAQTQFWSFAVQHQLTPEPLSRSHIVAQRPVISMIWPTSTSKAPDKFFSAIRWSRIRSTAPTQASRISTPVLLSASRGLTRNIQTSTCAAARQAAATTASTQVPDPELPQLGLSLSANYTWSHSLDDSAPPSAIASRVVPVTSVRWVTPRWPIRHSIGQLRLRRSSAPRRRAIWETPCSSTEMRSSAKGLAAGRSPASIPLAAAFRSRCSTIALTRPTTPFLAWSLQQTSTARGKKQAHRPGPNLFDGLDVPSSKMTLLITHHRHLGLRSLPERHDAPQLDSRAGAWNVDAALHKTFPITERMVWNLCRGINVLNHHNYYVNTTTLGGPAAM